MTSQRQRIPARQRAIFQPYYADIDDVPAADWQTLQTLNDRMVERCQALYDELMTEGQAAGLESDLVLDKVAGWLQVALDDAGRLAYVLKHGR